MSKYTEINIKQDMPTVNEAMTYLRESLLRLKRDKFACVLVIHGYGSTGKGGAICKAARQWLMAQQRNGKVKTVIFGEDFTIFNDSARRLKAKFAELEPLTKMCNNGVTVIEL